MGARNAGEKRRELLCWPKKCGQRLRKFDFNHETFTKFIDEQRKMRARDHFRDDGHSLPLYSHSHSAGILSAA